MRSGTSFFDLAIYRKTVNRFWPLWAVNLVIWLFLLPLDGLVGLEPGGTSAHRFALNVGDRATDFGIIFALLFALVVAMAVCSHMYNNRSANFMGSLPCRREGQFLSTYAAGLTILVGPNLLIFVLTLLVELAGGIIVWSALGFWLGAMCAMEFFFFSFAVCLGQFAGHILALPVFYGIFNAIVVAFYYLLNWVLEVYYFGFAGLSGVSDKIVLWCTPLALFFQMDIDVTAVGAGYVTDIEGLWVCGVYAVVGLVLAVCALLLYRRRHLETSGDIVAVRVMRPVFKYGVAICAGLFFGFLMDQMFSLGEIGMLVWMVVWGVVGCFVAQMLLDKSVRVFKKWKGAAAVAVVFLLLFAVVSFDLTGYESKVPAASNVSSVEISGLSGEPYYDNGSTLSGIVLTDPADIEKVIALHKGITEVGQDGEYSAREDYYYHTAFRVIYTMKDGGTMERWYSVVMGEQLLPLAQRLRDSDAVRRQAYGLDRIEGWIAGGAKLEYVSYNTEYLYSGGSRSWEWSGEEMELIWDAVLKDFEAGRIGTHTVGRDNYEKGQEQSYSTLTFQWRVPREVYNVTGYGSATEEYYASIEDKYAYSYVDIIVQEQSTETLKALEALTTVDNRYQDDPSDNPLARD